MITQVALRRPFRHEPAHAFATALPKDVAEAAASATFAVVMEDGRSLGPSGALHQHIRDAGAGAFSVWGSEVYFSSSDLTDCNANGRAYSLALVSLSRDLVVEQLSGDDSLLLSAIAASRGRNNSLALNFFNYYNEICAVLDRNGVARPETMLEIGAGSTPYTALRFLAEGVRRYVVNDIRAVRRTFPLDDIRNLERLLNLVRRGSGERLARIARTADGRECAIDGLEVHDEVPFEDAAIAGQVEFIFSSSVLEHVMKPQEVVARTCSLLERGGYAWHSIDLRDHRDFGKPLAFLEMTAEEYAAVDTENRLRASDWDAIFADAGFERVESVLMTVPPGRPADDANHVWGTTLPDERFVDEQMRARFKPPFDSRDLADLSILSVQTLYRKA
jgi:hypothetical protein